MVCLSLKRLRLIFYHFTTVATVHHLPKNLSIRVPPRNTVKGSGTKMALIVNKEPLLPSLCSNCKVKYKFAYDLLQYVKITPFRIFIFLRYTLDVLYQYYWRFCLNAVAQCHSRLNLWTAEKKATFCFLTCFYIPGSSKTLQRPTWWRGRWIGTREM